MQRNRSTPWCHPVRAQVLLEVFDAESHEAADLDECDPALSHESANVPLAGAQVLGGGLEGKYSRRHAPLVSNHVHAVNRLAW
jgi:hypothetical protein